MLTYMHICLYHFDSQKGSDASWLNDEEPPTQVSHCVKNDSFKLCNEMCGLSKASFSITFHMTVKHAYLQELNYFRNLLYLYYDRNYSVATLTFFAHFYQT